MTPMPTAIPAKTSLTQERAPPPLATNPTATNAMPTQTTCEATPQQAVERKCELSAAASPPRMHASGESFSRQKQNQAQRPRMSRAQASSHFEKPNGLITSLNPLEKVGDGDALDAPSQFRSCHKPFRIPGIWFCCATMPPNGPSFENGTS